MIAQSAERGARSAERPDRFSLRAPRSAFLAREGYVLLAVLMVIVVLSLAAYRFADAMSSEYQVAYRTTQAAQVRALAYSGVHYAAGALADPTTLNDTLGGNPYDNPSFFSNVAVGNNLPRGGGRFAIVSVADAADGGGAYPVKYGVQDEGGKVNLNAMMRIDPTGETLRAMLMLLPNMTEDVADSIVDWLDADEDQRASGAESGYYQALNPPYTAKNGPLNSLDELLLVKGVTADLLYGTDRNRNGRQDPGEGAETGFYRGWAEYLTVYGRELNVDSTGAPRVFINDTDLATLNTQLAAAVGQEMADYTVAYRLYTKASGTATASRTRVVGGAAELRAAIQKSLGESPTAKRSVANTPLSLRSTYVTLPKVPKADPNDPDDAPEVVVNCPITNADALKAMLVALLDKTTAKSSFELNPRINVNTASETLLKVLPGLTADDVAAAITARASLSPGSPEYTTGAWLVTQAGMRPEIFQQLAAYVTGTTTTYRVQSIGYFADGGPVARVEAVIDTNQGHPRIVYFRDLTDLGGGFTPPR